MLGEGGEGPGGGIPILNEGMGVRTSARAGEGRESKESKSSKRESKSGSSGHRESKSSNRESKNPDSSKRESLSKSGTSRGSKTEIISKTVTGGRSSKTSLSTSQGATGSQALVQRSSTALEKPGREVEQRASRTS